MILRSPAAEEDLIDIWCSIALDSPSTADRFLGKITDRIGQLDRFPNLGPVRPDIATEARALTVDGYLVLYRLVEADVEIVRVVHGSRDLTTLL